MNRARVKRPESGDPHSLQRVGTPDAEMLFRDPHPSPLEDSMPKYRVYIVETSTTTRSCVITAPSEDAAAHIAQSDPDWREWLTSWTDAESYLDTVEEAK